MQVLWSRAAQTRASSRCSSCLHAATTAARRTTTATSKRRLKASDIFTACYSTILASVAVADAKIKNKRTREWDRLIAEAKAEMAMREQEGNRELGTGAQNVTTFESLRKPKDFAGHGNLVSRIQAPTIWDGKACMATSPTLESSLDSSLTNMDAQLKQSCDSAPVAPMDVAVVASAEPSPDINESWITEEQSHWFPRREPTKKLHMDVEAQNVAILVDQLLLNTRAFSNRLRDGQINATGLDPQLRHVARKIEKLQGNFTPLPIYSWDNDISVDQKRSELHNSIITICGKTTPDPTDIDLMVAKICYNLLISVAPPSITTYNLLIREFTRLQQHDSAQVIVDGFLYRNRYAPSSMTISLILDHYAAKNDASGFIGAKNRMCGIAGNMRLKRRPVRELLLPEVQHWAQSNNVIRRGRFLVAKIPRDTKIFESLIYGSIELLGARPAVRVLRASLRECQGVRAATFCAVIKLCLSKQDYRSALKLLESILLFWKNEDMDALVPFPTDVRYWIHQLFAFCGIDLASTSTALFPHRRHVSHTLELFRRHMIIESIQDSINDFAGLILRMQSALGIQPFGGKCTTSSMIKTCNSLDLETASQTLFKHDKKLARRRCRLRVNRRANLQHRLDFLEVSIAHETRKLRYHGNALFEIVYGRLSKSHQKKYEEQIPIELRCSVHRNLTMAMQLFRGHEKVAVIKNSSLPNRFKKIDTEYKPIGIHSTNVSPSKVRTSQKAFGVMPLGTLVLQET